MADRSAVEEIKARINIVDVVKEHVPEVKKRGQNYFALCPFHSEKTPSFSVNEQMQIFKCFGCGAAGDVFTFLEKIEHLPFPEILEKLAERAGVQLEKFEVDPELKKKREKTLAINNLVEKLFKHFLTKHKVGSQARIYLKKRGLNGELINKFSLGWAPGNNLVLRALKQKGFSDEELIDSGIAKQREGRLVDTFWDRVIFPIYDEKGQTVAFMGRVIEKDRMPKYLNSPETVVYRKGRVLYGLNWAKEAIGKDDFAIVTEGSLNVISSFGVGRENIVAVLGTGFTKMQARLLKRYTNKASLAFDNDDAGKRATLRAIPIALEQDFDVGVIDIPLGKDVDDCAREDPKVWLSSAVSSKEAVDWVTAHWGEHIDFNTIAGKSRFTNVLRPNILAIKDPVKKEAWINRVAKEIGVKPATVEMSIKGSVEEIQEDSVSTLAKLNQDRIERFLLGFLLQYWSKIKDKRSLLKKSYLTESVYGRALVLLLDLDKDLSKEISNFEDDISLVCKDVVLMDLGMEGVDIKVVWEELVANLRIKRAEEIITALKNKIEKAEKKGEVKKAQEYLKRFQKLVDDQKKKNS